MNSASDAPPTPPASALRRVAITGLGVVSPLGNSPAALWDGLAQGRSGIAELQRLPPVDARVHYGGEAREFTGHIDDFGELAKDLKKSIRKALKMMCRESMMAVAAAQQALRDSDSDVPPDSLPTYPPERHGVVFGSDYMLSPPEDFIAGMQACGVGDGDFRYDDWGQTGLREMSPLWMLNYLPNMPASHIAIFNDLRGPNNSLTMREAAGLAAIREASQTIARGHADRILAGATGTRIHPFKTVHAIQTEQLADPNLDPQRASRPFDRRRTGMVVGEGAGAMVLESLDLAVARGAKIYGEVTGAGSGAVTTAELVGQTDEVVAHAAQRAASAGPGGIAGIGHLSAHGLGTEDADSAEAAGLHAGLGQAAAELPVVAAKAAMGNLGAGSGVVEAIASVLALQSGELYACHSDHEPDPNCRLAVVSKPGVAAGDAFLAVSFTPQGQACAIRIDRWQHA